MFILLLKGNNPKIEKEMVIETLEGPDKILEGHSGRKIAKGYIRI